MLPKRLKEVVNHSPLFSLSLSPKTLNAVFKRVPPAIYSANQILFYRGHFPYGLFVIQSGKVALEKSSRSKNRVVLGPGTSIGMGAVRGEMPYPFTAAVLETSKISFITKSMLQEWKSEKDPIFTDLLNAP